MGGAASNPQCVGGAARRDSLWLCSEEPGSPRIPKARSQTAFFWRDDIEHNFEELMTELFRLHDLDGDGRIGEHELIQLNKKIAVLHYGRDADMTAVQTKYRQLFRANFDPEGRPVGYERFQRYMCQVLSAMEKCEFGQRMILEQFIVEAAAARAAFHESTLEDCAPDFIWRPVVSFDEELVDSSVLDDDPFSGASSRASSSRGSPPEDDGGSAGASMDARMSTGRGLSQQRLPVPPRPAGADPKRDAPAMSLVEDASTEAESCLRPAWSWSSTTSAPRSPSSSASLASPALCREAAAVGEAEASHEGAPPDSAELHEGEEDCHSLGVVEDSSRISPPCGCGSGSRLPSGPARVSL